MTLRFPLSIEIGDLRAFPPAVFTNKWVVDQCITDTQFKTNSDHESKFHAWLLQEMTKTGRTHWKECADFHKQFRPTLMEVYANEYSINCDQNVKAINHVEQFLTYRDVC